MSDIGEYIESAEKLYEKSDVLNEASGDKLPKNAKIVSDYKYIFLPDGMGHSTIASNDFKDFETRIKGKSGVILYTSNNGNPASQRNTFEMKRK